MHAAAGEAVARARAGGGPSLLHVDVPRYYGHFNGDADTYRTPAEREAMWRDGDCLRLFRARVTEAALLEAETLDALDADVAALVDDAVRAVHTAFGLDAADEAVVYAGTGR